MRKRCAALAMVLTVVVGCGSDDDATQGARSSKDAQDDAALRRCVDRWNANPDEMERRQAFVLAEGGQISGSVPVHITRWPESVRPMRLQPIGGSGTLEVRAGRCVLATTAGVEAVYVDADSGWIQGGVEALDERARTLVGALAENPNATIDAEGTVALSR